MKEAISTRFDTLRDKLEDKEYINTLCDRRRKEILFCDKMMTDDELESYSSIDTAYKVARYRFVKDILLKYNEDLAERVLNGDRVPIFNKDYILKEECQ